MNPTLRLRLAQARAPFLLVYLLVREGVQGWRDAGARKRAGGDR